MNPLREGFQGVRVSPVSQPGIIVLGMHRSGTSVVAELLQRWGAYGKEEALIQGDIWNENGYWEYGPLVDFNEELLRAVSSSWHTPPADSDRPLLTALAQDAGYRGRALRLLEDMQAGGRPWFWKDPRLPVLLPFWKRVWGDVVFVVPVRDPVDIALSLQRRDRFSVSRSLLVWQRYMSEILLDQDAPGAALFLSYDKLLADAIGECARLCRFLEERLAIQTPDPAQRAQAMAEAVVPELRRNRTPIGFAQSPIATPAQKALYGMLEGLASGSPVELAATAGPEPHWREHLLAENAAQPRPKPRDSCEVYWRDSNSPYVNWRSRSVPIQEQRGPQSLRIALPPMQGEGASSLRIDLSQRTGFAMIDEIAVEDTLGSVVWAWDGRLESMQNLSQHQIRFCERQPRDRGCMLQLDGDDPWLEVVLDAVQSAALAKGATVTVEAEYIPAVEHLVQENARIVAELRESSARLDGLSTALRSEQAHMAASQAGIEGRAANLAASLNGIGELVASLAASQGGFEGRVANLAASLNGVEARIASLAASQAGIEARIANLAASLSGIGELVGSLAASQAGIEGRVANLAASLNEIGELVAGSAASQTGIEERVISLAASLSGVEARSASLAASQAGIEGRVANLAASLSGIGELVGSLAASQGGIEGRIANLAASQAGIAEHITKAEEAERAILQSRTWRLLTAGGRLLLRITGAFTRKDG